VHASVTVPLGCLARLQRAFDAGSSAPGHRPAAAVHGIVEPLTSRELQILEMLAGELGAASRTEAVARARQLALIP
jgi:hypothetical protein